MKRLATLLLLCALAAHAAAPEVPGWSEYRSGRLAAARVAFWQAAENGDRVAAFNLAMMDWNGEAGPVDKRQALYWLRRAAELQLAQAQHALGLLAERGDGVPKSLVEATRWFTLAARQGYLPAELDLGTQYFLGRGAPQDDRLAAYWYEEAAKQGDAGAQYLIASMYEHGQGVRRDIPAAIRWYARAAAQGDPGARAKALDLARRESARRAHSASSGSFR
ncbi:sel1 repeat family protein [Chromobacterium sp. ATCC 53434]|uniref:tetratricopeptide repeat protein n=1 Tax=Chromobacterium sp. (strain ATCC 53434 / SC 14030) TaxID=2059672 RepID=UPI000C786818|nr:tetratricopeptide repeat protein [Chromobacterium sp. ATCC 53434]AUH52995.1 sel1 repeat family protein [Chromobacterium sp. ATCC 53434]